jgi:hypothetical protein
MTRKAADASKAGLCIAVIMVTLRSPLRVAEISGLNPSSGFSGGGP